VIKFKTVSDSRKLLDKSAGSLADEDAEVMKN
jgi:hypothetical protein